MNVAFVQNSEHNVDNYECGENQVQGNPVQSGLVASAVKECPLQFHFGLPILLCIEQASSVVVRAERNDWRGRFAGHTESGTLQELGKHQPGECVAVVEDEGQDEEAKERFPAGWKTLKPYLRVTPQPNK